MNNSVQTEATFHTYKINTWFTGISLGLIVFFFAALFSRLNVDVHHQGIMFSAAMRILEGEKLYSGDSYYYGPIAPILNAFGMLVFGKHLIVIQLMAAACYGGIASLLWRIWARFLPAWLSGITLLLSFLLAPFLYSEFHPWSSVYSLLFLLLSLYFSFKWIETKKNELLSLVGIFAGLAFWARQTVGLSLGLVLLIILIFLSAYLYADKKTVIKATLFYLSGFFSTLLLGGIALFTNDSIRAWFEACFLSRLEWAVGRSGESAGLAQIFGTITQCLFDGFRPSIWMLLPVATIISLIVISLNMMRDRDRNRDRSEFAISFVYITVCLASWSQYYPVAEARHFFWAALPMCAIPVIAFWKVYAIRCNPLNGHQLFSSSTFTKIIVFGVSGLVVIVFSLTYLHEVRQRLFIENRSGLQLGAWKRLHLYNTRFVNPSILRGMLGTQSQVDSLNRLDAEIRAYVTRHPLSDLRILSGLDLLAINYLNNNTARTPGKVEPSMFPSLLLSDVPKISRSYQLLVHETIQPAFAYQATSPGQYYLYSAAYPLPVFTYGWSGDEGDSQWAISNHAEINILNNSAKPILVNLQFSLFTLKPRTVKITMEGGILQSLSLDNRAAAHQDFQLVKLAPGKNVLVIATDVSPAMPGNGDTRKLSFGISGFRVVEVSPNPVQQSLDRSTLPQI